MAGIIGIYGLVVSVLISSNLKQELPLFTGFVQLGAGLSVGLSGLAAGYGCLISCFSSMSPIHQRNSDPRTRSMLTHRCRFAIGIVGDAGVRGTAQQPRLFVGMILILIFAEVLGMFRCLVHYRISMALTRKLGLYGLIVALLMNSSASQDVSCT